MASHVMVKKKKEFHHTLSATRNISMKHPKKKRESSSTAKWDDLIPNE